MVSKHAFSTIISIPILFLFKTLAKFIPYTRQGFFCSDNEIRFPYREDTIGSDFMENLFLVVAIGLVIASEYSLIRHLTRKGRRLIVKSLHPFVYSFMFLMASYICSTLATTTATTFAKRTVCRLRPNFLAVCQPNLTLHCSSDNLHVFVEDYHCFGKFIPDEYYSFPSGHSSTAANFAVFFIIYLQKRNKFHEVFRAFIQFVIFLFTTYIMASRVRDYKHRLTDVLGGGALGALFALFFVTHVLNNFKANRYEICDDDECETPPNEDTIRAHLNNPIYPTVVISKISTSSRAGPCSEYGSLDDPERPQSTKGYDKI